MRLPLIVDSNGDLSVFREVRDMERYLEAADVHNNEYVVYDSEGRLVQLGTEWAPIQMLSGLLKENIEVVRLVSCDPEPNHADELSDRVRRFLAGVGCDLPAETPLLELVRTLEHRAGYTT
jgi:hypothetical protein